MFLERCVAAFRTESPDVVLVYPRSTVVDEHGAFLWEHSDRLDLRERAPHQRLKRLIWNPPTVGTAHYGLVRTTALRRGRGLQGFVSSDYVFLAELAMMGEFREVPECLLIKRYHPGMSREINPNIADLAEWTQPGSSQHLILEYWNLFARHLVAIHGSPLAFLDRARCYAVFVPNWLRVWRSQLVKELRGLPAELRRVRAAAARFCRQRVLADRRRESMETACRPRSPRLSVIIPCKNMGATIGAQLEALANQSWSEPWEVIVSDNGSSDDSVRVVQRYAARLPNLRLVDASDRPGASHARNVGARHATAPALAFCDADDEVGVDWLAAMDRALSRARFRRVSPRRRKAQSGMGASSPGVRSPGIVVSTPSSGGRKLRSRSETGPPRRSRRIRRDAAGPGRWRTRTTA